MVGFIRNAFNVSTFVQSRIFLRNYTKSNICLFHSTLSQRNKETEIKEREDKEIAKIRKKGIELMHKYFDYEKQLKENLDITKLTQDELKIHETHQKAADELLYTYNDPQTNYKVITRVNHFLREKCCGNACRHCVYNHENVPPEIVKTRRFNGAFWVSTEDDVAKD